MGLQTFQEALVAQSVSGSLFNTFTTAKTVIHPTSLIQLPPNYFYVGKQMRTTVWGSLSNIVTTPGTVTFKIMMGSIAVWSSGTIQMNATAHTNLPFWLVVLWRCHAIGNSTSAQIMGGGVLQGIHFTLTAAQVDAVNTSGSFSVPAIAPAVGTGFDSTISNVMDFFVAFSINDAGNNVTIQQYTVEAMN